jgi:DNA polymerase elongation subunit (family B)
VAAKKKYALLGEDGELVMRGMETRRRDWAKIARDTQERVLMAILKEKSREKAVNIVRDTVESLRKKKVSMDDLVIYTHITRPLSKYEQQGPHVKAARKLVQRGRPVGEGSTISYIITRGSGSISDRAEPAEDAENFDPEYYIYHQVLPPALRILSSLGVTEEDLAGRGKVRTLKTFFRK